MIFVSPHPISAGTATIKHTIFVSPCPVFNHRPINNPFRSRRGPGMVQVVGHHNLLILLDGPGGPGEIQHNAYVRAHTRARVFFSCRIFFINKKNMDHLDHLIKSTGYTVPNMDHTWT